MRIKELDGPVREVEGGGPETGKPGRVGGADGKGERGGDRPGWGGRRRVEGRGGH